MAAAEAAGGGISKVRDISYQGAAIVPLRYGACVGHGTCYTGEDLPVQFTMVWYTMVYHGMVCSWENCAFSVAKHVHCSTRELV